MPYYHTKDNGRVSFWGRKCQKCGRTWPISAYFLMSLPKGMIFVPTKREGETKYASWGDKFPGVSSVASHLPNWPRWFRVLVVSIFVVGVVVVIVYFGSC